MELARRAAFTPMASWLCPSMGHVSGHSVSAVREEVMAAEKAREDAFVVSSDVSKPRVANASNSVLDVTKRPASTSHDVPRDNEPSNARSTVVLTSLASSSDTDWSNEAPKLAVGHSGS